MYVISLEGLIQYIMDISDIEPNYTRVPQTTQLTALFDVYCSAKRDICMSGHFLPQFVWWLVVELTVPGYNLDPLSPN